MYQIADKSDLPGIAALWNEAFGDSLEAVSRFFEAFPDCISFVAREQGQVVSMVHALPQTLRAEADLPAAYLYAVATLQSHRGQGLCRGLMAFAEAYWKKQGFACAVLTPGEPSLFDFYRALGYGPAFARRRTAFSGGTPIPASDYLALREQLLPGPHMVYDLRTLTYARQIYGLTFYRTETGIAAASPDCTAEVLPEDLGGAPFAMIKWLDTPHPLKNAYLGFALE